MRRWLGGEEGIKKGDKPVKTLYPALDKIPINLAGSPLSN